MVYGLVQKGGPHDGVCSESFPQGVNGSVHNGKLFIIQFIEKAYLPAGVVLFGSAGMNPQIPDGSAVPKFQKQFFGGIVDFHGQVGGGIQYSLVGKIG